MSSYGEGGLAAVGSSYYAESTYCVVVETHLDKGVPICVTFGPCAGEHSARKGYGPLVGGGPDAAFEVSAFVTDFDDVRTMSETV